MQLVLHVTSLYESTQGEYTKQKVKERVKWRDRRMSKGRIKGES